MTPGIILRCHRSTSKCGVTVTISSNIALCKHKGHAAVAKGLGEDVLGVAAGCNAFSKLFLNP
jgi:hypothetical protein